jgi:hypothetical protein
MYREQELTVQPTGPLTAQLAGALDRLVGEAHNRPRCPRSGAHAGSREGRAGRVLTGEFDTMHAQEGSLVVAARSKEVGR